MDPKRLENIEWPAAHATRISRRSADLPEFSDWIAYEGSIEPQSIAWKIAEAAQEAAVYLVERNPELLELHGLDVPAWREASGNPQEGAQAELSPPPENHRNPGASASREATCPHPPTVPETGSLSQPSPASGRGNGAPEAQR